MFGRNQQLIAKEQTHIYPRIHRHCDYETELAVGRIQWQIHEKNVLGVLTDHIDPFDMGNTPSCLFDIPLVARGQGWGGQHWPCHTAPQALMYHLVARPGHQFTLCQATIYHLVALTRKLTIFSSFSDALFDVPSLESITHIIWFSLPEFFLQICACDLNVCDS